MVLQFAYLFPLDTSSRSLNLLGAVEILDQDSLKQKEIFLLEKWDGKHLMEVLPPLEAEKEPIEIARDLIQKERDFSLILESEYLEITCDFAVSVDNPHAAFNWNERQFQKMPIHSQSYHLNIVRKFASTANAAYVIFVEDPDYFEDHFVYQNGSRRLGLVRGNGRPLTVDRLWLNSSIAHLPVGASYTEGTRLQNGFTEYKLVSPPLCS